MNDGIVDGIVRLSGEEDIKGRESGLDDASERPDGL